MRSNGLIMGTLATIFIFLYSDGRTITCRHCLDSEIITIVPTVAPCCLRHVRQKCGRAAHCDKGLTCRYPYRHAPTGYCKVPTGKPCKVNGTLYQHGTKFKPDCRTSCFCENGIYGCSSLCPQEQIVPIDVCDNPQLVDVPGQCCREWLCEPLQVNMDNFCNINSTDWDECSSDCGGGVTYRESNTNSQCIMMKETRFCQKESCSGMRNTIELTKGKHQLRRKHSCRATIRNPTSYLRIGPCSSIRPFHPRQCGACLSNDICCKPIRTATLKVEMQCGALLVNEENNDIHKILMEYIIPGNDIWDPKDTTQYSVENIKNHMHKTNKRSVNKKDRLPFDRNGTQFKNVFIREDRNSDPYDDENNVHFINMEWVIKCECRKEYCNKDADYNINYIDDENDELIIFDRFHESDEITTKDTSLDRNVEDNAGDRFNFDDAFDNKGKDVILRRVHRTARRTKHNNY